ncbi:MAG: S8 family serine peptidase [Candidatus Thermoplasmatota archaeon]|nr:S8 family serine peptidase [Candidatus Thermoplasmatota archaeon]
MGRSSVAVSLVIILLSPLVGSIAAPGMDEAESLDRAEDVQRIESGHMDSVPLQGPIWWDSDADWWDHTSLDRDRNGIHDSLQSAEGTVNIGLSYSRPVLQGDIDLLTSLGYSVNVELPIVNALLLGDVNSSHIWSLADVEGVVMVERYGSLSFFGDIQTPAVKARNSTEYPIGAWDLGVTGSGMNIAMVDTGVDNEHPGLSGKFVAGYDAVCFVHSDPQCILAGGRQDDGSFDPDDGNQHGTACMGMASASGIDADGTQTDFYGSAPDSMLVDVRIGTDVGAGPFENYALEQEFYESAMNGLQWIIDHRDDAWPGVPEENHGIDIISLSWGITSHEDGGSDGTDMHSRILDEAMELGVAVSNAAGNDGENNDGLSGMSASSLSITVASTDDKNTIDRDDDTIASYSSRGPRKDNGDQNPLNELIPEISAPGTNIIQAEGCVSSGGCNNFVGGDASDNTYTGRGSGTSYAAPAVTGIVALICEANENLTPLQIKEILKHTSERRGEPSAPEIDPYWNREFGYGMVDALAAVELALFLRESGQTESIQETIQNHLLNVTAPSENGGLLNMTGHAWGQDGVVDRVEFRIDGGQWSEATYSDIPSEIGALTPFDWHVILDTKGMSPGEHSVEVHAVSGLSHSLPVFFEFNVTGSSSDSLSISPVLVGVIILVSVGWVSSIALTRSFSPLAAISIVNDLLSKSGNADNQAIMDAEIIESDSEK